MHMRKKMSTDGAVTTGRVSIPGSGLGELTVARLPSHCALVLSKPIQTASRAFSLQASCKYPEAPAKFTKAYCYS